MQNVLILFLLIIPLVGSSATIALIGYNTMEALGKKPSDAPRIFLKMIILLLLIEFFAAAMLSSSLLLFGK